MHYPVTVVPWMCRGLVSMPDLGESSEGSHPRDGEPMVWGRSEMSQSGMGQGTPLPQEEGLGHP